MAITAEEIRALGERWSDMLDRGGTVEDRLAFFLHPEPRIYVVESGASVSMAEHRAFHAQFARQRLVMGDFVVAQLSATPERARATGSLYWEAHFADPARPPLRCVVGEDWVVERVPSGALKFVLWMNTLHQFLPDSSVGALDLEPTAEG